MCNVPIGAITLAREHLRKPTLKTWEHTFEHRKMNQKRRKKD
jgi:hypothetical protein